MSYHRLSGIADDINSFLNFNNSVINAIDPGTVDPIQVLTPDTPAPSASAPAPVTTTSDVSVDDGSAADTGGGVPTMLLVGGAAVVGVGILWATGVFKSKRKNPRRARRNRRRRNRAC